MSTSSHHPLTLVGFVLLLFFGVHQVLVKSNIIPPVAKTHAPQIVKLLLTYGFVTGFGAGTHYLRVCRSGHDAGDDTTRSGSSKSWKLSPTGRP